MPAARIPAEQLVFNIIAKQAAPAAPRRARAAKEAKPAFPAMPKITARMLARANERPGISFDHRRAFTLAQPMPGVVPKNHKMAMDDAAWGAITTWATAGVGGGIAFAEGYSFLGYPYLSELAQIPEYRLISEVIATEMTRKFIAIKSQSEDDDKADKIRELEEEFERLGVRETFRLLAEQDGFFGRAHLYIDTGDSKNKEELKKPLGDGNKFTEKKVKKGFLRGIKPVEPVWSYPAYYNANNPFADNWYKPDQWFVMATQVHAQRFLTFVGREVPDLLKPAFSFGGLSLSQMAKPYVDNWLQTRQSVNDIIQAFSVMVLKTDMSTLLQGNSDGLYERADLFNKTRDNRGLMMLDKNNEDFANVSAPLSGLDKLQAQAQEHMASVSRIPLVKLTGISPSGLNASSEGEIRVFYDTIHAYQEKFFTPHLTTVFKLAQINIWGKVDPDLIFEYEPLWELDEQQVVEMQATKAKTHQTYVEMGATDGYEVRQSLVDDPNSPYENIDPDDVPALEEPLPKNVRQSDKVDETPGEGEGKPADKDDGEDT